MDGQGVEGYSKLSNCHSKWKKEVLQHCNSGVSLTTELAQKEPKISGLEEIRHEFYEIIDHLK